MNLPQIYPVTFPASTS